MESPQKNIQSWLEKLQQESWNLELLISGFSIFLLIQIIGTNDQFLETVPRIISNRTVMSLALTFLSIFYLAVFVLTMNLVIHIILRGFWIGAIGLRSVQDKPQFEKLGYSQFFAEKLKKNVIDLDDLLKQLDVICSAIFSFTFLIIFMLGSLFLYLSAVVLIGFLLNLPAEWWPGISEGMESVTNFILLVMLLLGLLYFLDTLTLGWFKRNKWISRIYYPIYKVIGWVILANIYRSIYYYLITRFPKMVIRAILTCYLLGVIIIPAMEYDDYVFFPDNYSDHQLLSSHYDDQRLPKAYITTASIPSAHLQDDFLPVFIAYNIRHNEIIKARCPEFEPAKKGGIKSGIKIGLGTVAITTPDVNEPNVDSLLSCISSTYQLFIGDSLCTPEDFFYYRHPNQKEPGLYTMLDIGYLDRGLHKLIVKTIGSEENVPYAQIPFWKK